MRLLHREVDDGKCRCGQRMDRCAVAQIVGRYPGLRRWEEEQVKRLRRGSRMRSRKLIPLSSMGAGGCPASTTTRYPPSPESEAAGASSGISGPESNRMDQDPGSDA